MLDCSVGVYCRERRYVAPFHCCLLLRASLRWTALLFIVDISVTVDCSRQYDYYYRSTWWSPWWSTTSAFNVTTMSYDNIADENRTQHIESAEVKNSDITTLEVETNTTVRGSYKSVPYLIMGDHLNGMDNSKYYVNIGEEQPVQSKDHSPKIFH